MKKHLTNTRAHLGELAVLAAQSDASERHILKSAQRRLAEVTGAINRLRAGLDGAPEKSQDRYLELTREQGQLHIIIAKAQGVIA